MEVKIEINVKVQYLITGDVNWLNAAAGSVLPTKIRGVNIEKLSPLATEVSQSIQDYNDGNFDLSKSALRTGTNFIGFGLGKTANSVGMDNGYSTAQNFIFQNGIQSFHNNMQGEMIKLNVSNSKK